MRLLLIRHGESEADLLGVHEGRADFPLTDRGRRQAKAMAAAVAKRETVDRIYASPLTRAKETASFLSVATGVSVSFNDDLMEFNNGLLAGLSRKEADEKYPMIPDLPVDQAVYGMESKQAFRQRAERVLTRIITENSGHSTVAVVTHGGMIDQLYHALLGLPVESVCRFRTDDTGVHIWELTEQEKTVVSANDRTHLSNL